MVDVVLVRQPIEPGETERARELLSGARDALGDDEVVGLIQREGVYTESAFLEETDDGDYVVYYIEAEDGERVYEVFQDIVDDPDDELIREFTEVMAGEPTVADVDLLYHLVNPERPRSLPE
ncbi:DUF6176 family protein [Halobacteriaceae archaeon GCM10025711]